MAKRQNNVKKTLVWIVTIKHSPIKFLIKVDFCSHPIILATTVQTPERVDVGDSTTNLTCNKCIICL